MKTVSKRFETLEDLRTYVVSYKFKPSDKCNLKLLMHKEDVRYKLNWWGYRIPYTAFYLHHWIESTGDTLEQVSFSSLWTCSNQLGLRMSLNSYQLRKDAIAGLFKTLEEQPELSCFEDGQLLLSEQAFNVSKRVYDSCKICVDPIKEV